MIYMCESQERPVLRIGDEPEDLARGRLLSDLLTAEGRTPALRYPRKGIVSPPTSLRGYDPVVSDGEWLIHRLKARIPADRRWLLALAGGAVDATPGPEATRIPDGPELNAPAGSDGPELNAPAGSDELEVNAPAGSDELEVNAPGVTALKDMRVLLASARRSAAHDISYAFRALAGTFQEVRRDPRLRAFREETARAVSAALKARPVFSWRVALVRCPSAESVEEIVAARWRDKLSRYLVLAANPVYVASRVTFAFRCGASLGEGGVDGRGIILSALPGGEAAVRTSPDGRAGRGSLPTAAFGRFLERLRFPSGGLTAAGPRKGVRMRK